MIKIKRKSSRKPDIEIKDLLLFWNIIQYDGFGRAGAAMGFSQPKVTRRVKLLEESFGTQLLYRNPRGVALTKSGEHVLEMARAFVERIHSVRILADQEEKGENGLITVAAASGFGHFWLLPVLREFMDLYPNVRINFKPEEAGSVGLMLGQADILIASEPVSRQSLVCDLLCSYHFHLYAHANYVTRKGMPKTIEELGSHDLVVWSHAKHVNQTVSDGLLRLGLAPDEKPRLPKALVQDDHSLFAMTAHGVGMCISPAFFFGEDQNFVRIPCFEQAGLHEKTLGSKHIIYNKSFGESSRTRRLVEFIKQKAGSSKFFIRT